MTTIKDLKKWLDNFPEDTIVEVAFQEESTAFESHGPVEFKEPKLDVSNYGCGWEYVDFTESQFVTAEDDRYGKKYLYIGEVI